MPNIKLYRHSPNAVCTSWFVSISFFIVCAIGLQAFFAAQLAAQEPSHSPGWVVISVPDYHALRIKAFPTEREPEPPPVDATLSRVEYELLADSGVASGRATLTVDVLKNGWVRVPIPAGLFVQDAKLDGKPLSLAPANGGGQLSALLAHPGRAIMTLNIALPLEAAAGEERLSLPSTSSGVTRVTLEIPRTGVDLTLYGGIFAESKGAPDKNKWTAYGSGSQPVVFAWHRKIEEHQNTLLRLHGQLTQFVGLGEDSTSLGANLTLEVVQGIAKEVRVRVPANVTINQVQGAAVADWEMKSGELLITFIEPVEQSTSCVITGEAAVPRDGRVEIPLLRLVGVERETGGLGVDVLGAGEIREDSVKTQGLLRADATDLGEPVSSRQSPALLAFRTHSGDSQAPRSLNITVTRYTQQAVLLANVSEARYRVLFTRDGKSLVEARYAVRNSQRSFVKITLPAGATLWSAALSGEPIRPGAGPDASLLVPLSKARSGEEAPEFAVEVIYFAPGAGWTNKGHIKLSLPALDLPVSRTGLQVFYPPQFKLATEAGSFRSQDYADPISAVLSAAAEEPPVDSESSPTVSGANKITTLTPPASPGGVRGDATKADDGKQSAQTLVEKFHASERGSRTAGVLPLTLKLPLVGPSVYLISQLTSESQVPTIEFSYQQDKKAGGK
jgi:hypothetical protein